MTNRHGSFFLQSRVFRKCIAFAIALSLSSPNNLVGIPKSFAGSPAKEMPVSRSAQALEHLHLSSEIGTISDSYRGNDSRTVFLIQDAHAIPDAQQSILRLVQYFQKEYGIEGVGIEGAVGDLDPLLLRRFPDEEILSAVLDDFLRRGELSGAAAASILSKEPADYFGIEDESLYVQDIDAFLKALQWQPSLVEAVHKIQGMIEELKPQYYSETLLVLDQKIAQSKNDSGKVFELFDDLNRLGAEKQIAPPSAEEYPHLAAVLESIRKETASEGEQGAFRLGQDLRLEIGKIFAKIEKSGLDKNRLQALNASLQAYQTETLSPEDFLGTLRDLSRQQRLPVEISSEIRKLMDRQALIKNMKAVSLFRETDLYLSRVKGELFRGETEQKLDDLSRTAELLAGLADLKLNLEEWKELKEKIDHRPQSMDAGSGGLRTIDHGLWTIVSLLRSELSDYCRFYESALRRDHAMAENLLSFMEKKGKGVSVAVTGGFHTQGLMEEFKKRGISYAVITPAIRETPKDSRYFDFMQGRVSWSSYFETRDGHVDLFRAFHKAVTDRLIKELQTRGRNTEDGQGLPVIDWHILKRWRDRVLEELAGQGRLADAPRYTRYIDEAAMRVSDPKKWEVLKAEWIEKVDHLIEGLSGLRQNNKLTPENVLGLLKASKAAPKTSVPLDPGFMMPADWITPIQTKTLSLPFMSRASREIPSATVSQEPAARAMGAKPVRKIEAMISEAHGAVLGGVFGIGDRIALRIPGIPKGSRSEMRADFNHEAYLKTIDPIITAHQPGLKNVLEIQELALILLARKYFFNLPPSGGDLKRFRELQSIRENIADLVPKYLRKEILSAAEENFFRGLVMASYPSKLFRESFLPVIRERRGDGREILEDMILISNLGDFDSSGERRKLNEAETTFENLCRLWGLAQADKSVMREVEHAGTKADIRSLLKKYEAQLSAVGREELGGFELQSARQAKISVHFDPFLQYWEMHFVDPSAGIERIVGHLGGAANRFYDIRMIPGGMPVIEPAAETSVQAFMTFLSELLPLENQQMSPNLRAKIREICDRWPDYIVGKRSELRSVSSFFDGEKFSGRATFKMVPRSELRNEEQPSLPDFYQYRGIEALRHLPELNHTIASLAEQPNQGRVVESLEALRNTTYADAVREAAVTLAGNLKSEMPGVWDFMDRAAEASGDPNVVHDYRYQLMWLVEKFDAEDTWKRLAADNATVEQLYLQRLAFEQEMTETDTWAEHNAAEFEGRPVVYYSAEFAYHLLRGYGGGLGVLSGDHSRGADDLGLGIKDIPDPKKIAEQLKTAKFIGVGIFYTKGNFVQFLDGHGNQTDQYFPIDTTKIPLYDLADAEGNPVSVEIEVPDTGRVKVQAKVCFYGRQVLLLGTTNVDGNSEKGKSITERLYIGDPGTKQRMPQYAVIGAMREILTERLGIDPGVEHLNDNHPWPVVVQRVAHYMKQYKDLPGFEDPKVLVDAAIRKARAGIVFTTHTPVPAGNEKTGLDIAQGIISSVFSNQDGLTEAQRNYAVQRLLAFGTLDHQFNLTAFLLRMSVRRNAVSELHGEVSRSGDMWKRLYPGLPAGKVPIDAIVNSVHTGFLRPMGGYFASRGFTDLFNDVLGDPEVLELLLNHDPAALDQRLSDAHWMDQHVKVDEAAMWSARIAQKQALFREIEKRFLNRGPQCLKLGATRDDLLKTLLEKKKAAKPEDDPEIMKILADYDLIKSFDPEILTIGFARRVATYKRLLLLLSDPKRLEQIIADSGGKIQFVFAGRAHPADQPGQELIRKFHEMIKPWQEKGLIKVVYVEEYDLQLARVLEAGVDVWLNNPVRPQEASGTSGMKVMINGGLNLSILDGWWAEACLHGINGWGFGKTKGTRDDRTDSEHLYQVLEKEVLPAWKDKTGWARRMKASFLSGVYRFGMERMLAAYFDQIYRPALVANAGTAPENLADQVREDHATRARINAAMSVPKSIRMTMEKEYPQTVFQGEPFRLRAIVDFNDLNPAEFGMDLMVRPLNRRPVGAESEENDTWTFVGADEIEPLMDGKYRVTFGVSFPEFQEYEFKLRVRPSDTDLFETAEELRKATRYAVFPREVEVLDSRLFRFRAKDVTPGRLFYLHIPPQMPVRSVRFGSKLTNWFDGEPVWLRRLDEPGSDAYPEHDVWAAMVPPEIAQGAGYHYAFQVTLEDGRVIRVPEGRNKVADIFYGSGASWLSSSETASNVLAETGRPRKDGFLMQYFMDNMEPEVKLETMPAAGLVVRGSVRVRLPEIAIRDGQEHWRFYIHYGFDPNDPISWKTIPLTASAPDQDGGVLLAADFLAPRYGSQLEYKIIAVPAGVSIENQPVKEWSKHVLWSWQSLENRQVSLGDKPAEVAVLETRPPMSEEAQIAREIMVDYMLGSRLADQMLSNGKSDYLIGVIESLRIFLGEEIKTDHQRVHVYVAKDLPPAVQAQVGKLGVLIVLCPREIASHLDHVRIFPPALHRVLGFKSGRVELSIVSDANAKVNQGLSLPHYQTLPRVDIPDPGYSVLDLSRGEGIYLSPGGIKGKKNVRVFGLDKPPFLDLLDLLGRALEGRAREHDSEETAEAGIAQLLRNYLEMPMIAEESLVIQTAMGRMVTPITTLSKDQARAYFKKADAIPSIMAFITFLIPSFLEKIKDWDLAQYQYIRRMIAEHHLEGVLRNGVVKVFIDELDHKRGVVFAKTFEGRTVFFGLYPSTTTFIDEEGKAPLIQVRLTPALADTFGIREDVEYQPLDLGAKLEEEKLGGLISNAYTRDQLIHSGLRMKVPILASKKPDKHHLTYPGGGWQVIELVEKKTEAVARPELRKGEPSVLPAIGVKRSELRAADTPAKRLAVAAYRNASYKRLIKEWGRERYEPVQDGIPEIWASDWDHFRGEQWGRDAFIALPGLLLTTGRYEEAKKYLLKFGQYVSGGLIPNKIWDSTKAKREGLLWLKRKKEALAGGDLKAAEEIDRKISAYGIDYNNADASMWYAHAVGEYLKLRPDDEDFKKQALPILADIIENYSRSKDQAAARYLFRDQYLSVYMDQEDGLIVSPQQATWMDAWPGSARNPFTPRAGKVVEINAMWHECLQTAAALASGQGQSGLADSYREKAGKVADSFRKKFWNQAYEADPENATPLLDYIADTEDIRSYYRDNGIDDHQRALRPNMVFAVTHGGEGLLTDAQRKAVVESAHRHLLSPFGMRTLGRSDSHYAGNYKERSDSGNQHAKDEAYHQGTVWPWLLGAFIDAYAATHGEDPGLKQAIGGMLEPLLDFTGVSEAQSLPEVFDGDAPANETHRWGGTRSQAWSVAEILRVAVRYGILDGEEVRGANLAELAPYGVEISAQNKQSVARGTDIEIAGKIYIPTGLAAEDLEVRVAGDWNEWGNRNPDEMEEVETAADGSYVIYRASVNTQSMSPGTHDYKIMARRKTQDRWEWSAGENHRFEVTKAVRRGHWSQVKGEHYPFVEFAVSWSRRKQNDPGIGKFTDLENSYREYSRLGAKGFLLMPFYATFGGPYDAVFIRALNEDYIDWAQVEEVRDQPGLLRLLIAPAGEQNKIHFENLHRRERQVAERAYALFLTKAGAARKAEFARFLEERPWLGQYGELAALFDLLGRPAIDCSPEEIEAAKGKPEYQKTVGLHQYAQFEAYRQFRAAVAAIRERGGKIFFDMPGFRAKASVLPGVNDQFFHDARNPNAYPGIKIYRGDEIYVNEHWGSLALWNWEALRRDGYRFILDDVDYLLELGLDGMRVDAAHFFYDFRTKKWGDADREQFGPGGEPGDDFVAALAEVLEKHNALGIAEAFEGTGPKYRAFGFRSLKVASGATGNADQVSGHDDPRVFTSASDFSGQLFSRMLGYGEEDAAITIFPGGTLEGDTVPIKEMEYSDGVWHSHWEYRLPLESDPDYNDRIRYDARRFFQIRMALLEAAREGNLWQNPEILASLLSYDAERFVRRFSGGRVETNRGHDPKNQAAAAQMFKDMSGLLLARGQFEEAKRILEHFADFEASGQIPNHATYPESTAKDSILRTIGERERLLGERREKLEAGDTAAAAAYEGRLKTLDEELTRNGIEYDGPDASLWFIHAVREYLEATGDEDFVRKLLPVLRSIADHMMDSKQDAPERYYGRAGAYDVYSDADGLLVVPRNPSSSRYGKLVDLNALWFGSLDFLIKIEEKFNPGSSVGAERYRERQKLVGESFRETFFNEDKSFLIDAVDDGTKGDALRPYQLFAVTHAPGLLAPKQIRSIFNAVREWLWTPMGLRTLDPRHDDYNGLNPDQGGVNPWLLPYYFDTLKIVRAGQADPTEIQAEIRRLLTPLLGQIVLSPSASLPESFEGQRRRDILRLMGAQKDGSNQEDLVLPQRPLPLENNWPNSSSSIAGVLSVIERFGLVDSSILRTQTRAVLQPYEVRVDTAPVYDEATKAHKVSAVVFLPPALQPEDASVQIWAGDLVKNAEGKEIWTKPHAVAMKLVGRAQETDGYLYEGMLPDRPVEQELTVRAVRNEMRTGEVLLRDYRWADKKYRVHAESALWQAESREAIFGLASNRFVRYTHADGRPVTNGIPVLWAADWDWFFEQWGRDALISLPGLLLVPGRYEEARSVLLNFGRYVSGGLIPNKIWNPALAEQLETEELLRRREQMVREHNFEEVEKIDRALPAHGLDYNNADASMWFMHAVEKYLEARPQDEDFKKRILPVLRNIADNYSLPAGEAAARYTFRDRYLSVYMDEDGLIVSPEQSTWMDAWPDGAAQPITPRAGKAVEINAMWYAGLRLLESLEADYGSGARLAAKYGQMAALARNSFRQKFQNPAYNTDEKAAPLFDYVADTEASRKYYSDNHIKIHEAAIRPNMIFAVTHGGKDLLEERWKSAVVASAEKYLLTPYGMRTLAPSDSHYKGDYRRRFDSKNQLEKDLAYHQGTVWPWLIGVFADAYAAVHPNDEGLKEKIRGMLETLLNYPKASDAKSLPEVFDGDIQPGENHRWGGTRSQAWSVAEVLRVAVQYGILDRDAVGYWSRSAVEPYRVTVDTQAGQPQIILHGVQAVVPVRAKVYVPAALSAESLDVNVWMTSEAVGEWNQTWKSGQQAAALRAAGKTEDGAVTFEGEIPLDQLRPGRYPWIVRAGVKDRGQWKWAEGGNRQTEIRPPELPNRIETVKSYVRSRPGEGVAKLLVRVQLAEWMSPEKIRAKIVMASAPLSGWNGPWTGENLNFPLTKISGPDQGGVYTYEAEIPVGTMAPGKYEYVPLVALAGSEDWKSAGSGNSRLEIPAAGAQPASEARPSHIQPYGDLPVSIAEGEDLTLRARVYGGQLDVSFLEAEVAGDFNTWGARQPVAMQFENTSDDGSHFIYSARVPAALLLPGSHELKLRVRRQGTDDWKWAEGDNHRFEVKARSETREERGEVLPAAIRAELRIAATKFLGAITAEAPGLNDVIRFADIARSLEWQFVAAEMRTLAPEYAVPYAVSRWEGGVLAQVIADSDAAETVRQRFPDYDQKAGLFIDAVIAQMESAAEKFFEQNPKGIFELGFAIPYQETIAPWLLQYSRKIQELKETYAVKGKTVRGNLGIMVTAPQQKDAKVRSFLAQISRSGAKSIAVTVPETGAVHLRNFLSKNPKAFIYGLSEAGIRETDLDEKYRGRIVDSRVSLRETLPVAVVLDVELAAVGHISAELLKNIPQVVPGTRFTGRSLEILFNALDLVYRDYVVGKLIAVMA
jgi:starch phosphorylase